jgi:phytoene synthase
MSARDTLSHCAREARRRDPDRYFCALFAPAGRREALFALLAFNAEIARVREEVSETMVGMIRLQWWRDAIAAMAHGTAPRHDVVEALASAITETALTSEGLVALIDAREHDLDDEPPATLAALESYAGETSAALTGLALDVLGAGGDASARKAGRHVGIAFALSGLLRAVPFHARARRLYLPVETMAREGADAEAVFAMSPTPALGRVAQAVAEAARGHIASARTRDVPRHALAALLPASLAASDLARLARAGHDVFDPRLTAGGTGRRLRTAMRGIVGRF